MARVCEIARPYAWQIIEGRRPLQPKHARAIEQAVNYRWTRYDLRPDIFGEPEDDPRPAPPQPSAAA